MTAQDLKNAILQLAVQGKLVPQDPNDEAASELLKRIRAEKERLVKEGKIKKEKPLSSITDDEIPFDIPESWEWIRFGECGVLKSGFAFKSTEYTTSGIQVVRISDLADNGISCKDAVYYCQSDALAPYLVSNNSFLICMTGSIGKMAWVQDNIPRYLNQRVGMFEPLHSCDTSYLWWFLHTSLVLFQWLDAKTSTNGNIKNSDITELLLPIPSFAEQQRIVAKIEELMPLVEEYGKAEEQLTALNTDFPDKLRKSILQQAIQGKLTERDPSDEPASELLKRICAEKERLVKEGKIKKEKPLPPITEEEMPFELPENWAWTRIGDVFEVNPRNNVLDETEVGFIPMPLLEPGFVNRHMFEKRLWKEVKKNFTHFQNGDVVFAKITPCFQNRKSAIMVDLPNGYGAGTTELHVLRPFSGLIFNEYVLWYVKNERFILDGVEHFTGSVGQQRVGTDYIKQYPFPLPPLAEQQRIVDRVNELLAVCEELKL